MGNTRGMFSDNNLSWELPERKSQTAGSLASRVAHDSSIGSPLAQSMF